MRNVIVTPAGRRRYLEILEPYVRRAIVAGEAARWDIWMNTQVPSDEAYIRQIAAENPDIYRVVEHIGGWDGNFAICQFFRGCIDPDETYVRVDDDIVFMESGAIRDLAQFRRDNPEPFLVYGNIVNNSICTHLHQRAGLTSLEDGIAEYICMGANSWNNPKVALREHQGFLDRVERSRVAIQPYIFDRWIAYDYERISINTICWTGADFAKFGGEVGMDEEDWLSCQKPRELGRPNVIYGGAIFSHFAYFTQRPWLEANTDILERYHRLSKRVLL